MTDSTATTDATTDPYIRVAATDEIVEGQPKAVRVGSRSIALFRHEGDVFATDNQCPHMGFPLTKGRVRNGVLTCDWHGWSYDIRGGGCFTGGCDDLDTYPVEVRDGDIYVDPTGGVERRSDAHILLLREGLFSGDDWTLSKAVAILLARGVSEDEALRRLVRHLAQHVPIEGGVERQVAFFANGTSVARHYPPEERLIPLMMAASGAAGRIDDRPPVQPLPAPVGVPDLLEWIRLFSADREWEGIEKCIISIRSLGGHDEAIMPHLFDCAVAPHFIGHGGNLLLLVHLADIVHQFGWDDTELLVAHAAARSLGQGRNAPDEIRQEAIDRYAAINDAAQRAEALVRPDSTFDEDAFSLALTSGELAPAFDAITDALRDGVALDRLVTTMVLTAANRMARTPVGMNPGWGGAGARADPVQRHPLRACLLQLRDRRPRPVPGGMAVLQQPVAQHQQSAALRRRVRGDLGPRGRNRRTGHGGAAHQHRRDPRERDRSPDAPVPRPLPGTGRPIAAAVGRHDPQRRQRMEPARGAAHDV